MTFGTPESIVKTQSNRERRAGSRGALGGMLSLETVYNIVCQITLMGTVKGDPGRTSPIKQP